MKTVVESMHGNIQKKGGILNALFWWGINNKFNIIEEKGNYRIVCR